MNDGTASLQEKLDHFKKKSKKRKEMLLMDIKSRTNW